MHERPLGGICWWGIVHTFSFDIGTNSDGWGVLRLDQRGEPCGIIAAGVRIYSDGREPKSGTSLAEGRRVARGMSRRRDRYKRRRRAVLNTLVEYGLMPDTSEARKALVAETNDKGFGGVAADVYALRTRALDEKLPPFHLGRALFHLNQRRGFKSNRKTDSRDNEQGKIALGISKLAEAMVRDEARTLGELLFKRRGTDPSERGWVRVRPQRMVGKDGKEEDGYGYYPERSFLEREFDLIWQAQARHSPELLTEERHQHLKLEMFFQRPLKRPKVGKCSFNPHEDRLPKAYPLFQQFRLIKEINELGLVFADTSKRNLTLDERDALVKHLASQREATFASLRKTIKAPYGARFNKESESRLKLKGDEVAAELSAKSRFGQGWFDLTPELRTTIVLKLTEVEDPLALHAWLEAEFPLTLDRRDAIVAARLPDGYARLGPTALSEILAELKAEVIPEAEAARRAGYDHALLGRGDAVTELPKYQEVLARRIPPGSEEPSDPYDVRKGRITNPTIHIGLNQLQKVANALIGKYGRPEQIALELARELKLSEAEKAEVNGKIAKNTREAERRSAQLRELGQIDNGYNRLLLKLWEELNPEQPLSRECIYCGEPIGVATLFSAAVDIDHILPWSQTLDDSQANRIVCHKECNRQKGNHAPAQVHQWAERYDAILSRAQRLLQNKRWRFGRDAMDKFKDDESFIARQLTDTQYLSRMAHEYLGALYEDEEPDEWGCSSGATTCASSPGG